MLEFREISLDDKEWIDSLLSVSDFQGCEYCFANNLAWRRLANSQICRIDDFYVLRSFDGGVPRYTYPAGKGDIVSLVDKLKDDAKSYNAKLKMFAVPSEPAMLLKSIYGDSISVSADRDAFDYIYRTDRLIAMSGKKLHGKRNHIANFKKSDWEYVKLTADRFDECIEFSAQQYNEYDGFSSVSAVSEQFAINTFFTNFDTLKLVGGTLYQNGRLVGFTIGEKLNSNTFVIHIEKALKEIQGAYPTLFNEFLKAEASDCEFVNREDDVGIDGLRKSKLSYYPDYLLEKNIVDFD